MIEKERAAAMRVSYRELHGMLKLNDYHIVTDVIVDRKNRTIDVVVVGPGMPEHPDDYEMIRWEPALIPVRIEYDA